MQSVTLDEFMAWNEQLAALAEAGVPVQVDLGQRGEPTSAALEKVNSTIARRMSQGESLVQAIATEDRALSPLYRTAMRLGLAEGNPTAAWIATTQLAQTADEASQATVRSLIYPAIVCALAYVGLVGFCLFFVPTLEGIYQSARMQPGMGLNVLQILRNTLPYWVPLPPLIGLALIGSQFRPRRGSSMLTGAGRVAALERLAAFAEAVATLLEHNVPMDEAISVAAGALTDSRLETAVRALVSQLPQEATCDGDGDAARELPPLLRYALCQSDESVGRPRALRMAADVYRQLARRRLERLRLVMPMVVCVVIGGGVTLLYGLSLFVPVVELLYDLAR